MNDYAKQLIEKRLNAVDAHIIFTKVHVPHKWPGTRRSPVCYAIYTGYIDSFDYHIWAKDAKVNATCIKIPDSIKLELAECQQLDKKPSSAIVDWIVKTWDENTVLGQNYFARLSSTSGKNEKAPFPIKNATDLIHYLCRSNYILLNREYAVKEKDSYLILQPWKEIDKRFEFRAFFRDGRVICASQQFISRNFDYTQEELDIFQEALSELSFPNIKYIEWCADLYWDGEKMQLIECNPYGAHSGAGAGLFNWEDDQDVFSGKKPGEFRYIHVLDI